MLLFINMNGFLLLLLWLTANPCANILLQYSTILTTAEFKINRPPPPAGHCLFSLCARSHLGKIHHSIRLFWHLITVYEFVNYRYLILFGNIKLRFGILFYSFEY